MLGREVGVQRLKFSRQPVQRVLPQSVREFGSDAMVGPAQFLDASHRVMHGAELCFDLRQQIELVQY